MRKNEKGVLTVEASIVLCVFSLFILFLFNFATVYRAENMVSHATLQTADAVALESYLRETSFETDEQRVLFWANRINGVTTISEDSFESLRTADLQSIAKEKFILAIDDDSSGANTILKSLGVQDGLNGIDFSESYVDLNNNDVIIKANYTVKLKFPVFGATELNVSKAAKAKTAGEILFGINVIPEQQIMGITKGTGKYKFGTEIQISAEANYGYDFVSWDDGNTDNPRTVTVADAKTYVAKFKRHNFGVNLFISDSTSADGRVKGSNKYGTVTAVSGGASSVGGNEYSYESTVTVNAAENPGYDFQYWRGSKVSDSGTESIYKTEQQFSVFIDGTYDLTATYKPIVYGVSVSTTCDAAKNSIGVRKFGTTEYKKSISLEYGNQIELKANEISGYTFKGWYKDGIKVSETTYKKIDLPVGGGNYEAEYEKDPIIRVVASGQGTVKIVENDKTSYCCKKRTSVEVVATPKPGYYFAGWSDGGSASHWVTVNSDITLTATFKPLYSITVTSAGGGTASGGGTSLKSGTTTTINATPNTGYHFVKWQVSTDGGKNYYDISWNSSYTINVNGNVSYKAIFEANVYTVTLDANGGFVSAKSSHSYSVNHGSSSKALPRPVRQGYRFNGWKYNGSTYYEGNKVSNIGGNITLVAQWKKCNSHVWGRCGVTHTATNPCKLSFHSSAHNTSKFQCVVCVECGKFDDGTCPCTNFNANLNRSKIGAVHLCYTTDGCANKWNNEYKESKGKVYNVHKEYGYP